MSIRILLVEDDPVSRDLLASLLLCRGYDVDTAEDGFNALRFVQDKAYDLVFIDYHLPEMDGYALARLMRTLGEKTGTNLNMVAITADRFGLTARRGVDSIFDSMLTKPIDPDHLYGFIDAYLAAAQPVDDGGLGSFLDEPSAGDAQSAAQVLWRVRGLADLPTAAAFPMPSETERRSLEYCFRLVDAAEADCLVLVHPTGLAAVEALRAGGAAAVQPLVTLDETSAPLGDVLFKVGDKDSWTAVATVLADFRDRRTALRASASEGSPASDPAMRLATYLYLAGRPLILRRDAAGRTSVPYTGGFAAEGILAAIKRLAAAGLMVAKPGEARTDGMRELVVSLTAKGLDQLVEAGAATLPAVG